MIINFKLLTPTARLPVKNHETDAGIDFFADKEHYLGPNGGRDTISTGVAWEPYFIEREKDLSPLFKVYMQIQGRSGLASKNGIAVLAGVIDSEYRGEIKIVLVNTSNEEFKIYKGDKIAQGIVLLTPSVMITMNKEIGETSRGEKGFGSSGWQVSILKHNCLKTPKFWVSFFSKESANAKV